MHHTCRYMREKIELNINIEFNIYQIFGLLGLSLNLE